MYGILGAPSRRSVIAANSGRPERVKYVHYACTCNVFSENIIKSVDRYYKNFRFRESVIKWGINSAHSGARFLLCFSRKRVINRRVDSKKWEKIKYCVR